MYFCSSGSGFYHQAPLRPPSRPPPPPVMSATPAAAVTGATPSRDPFEDLDPLRSSLASPQPQTPMSDHHNPPSRYTHWQRLPCNFQRYRIKHKTKFPICFNDKKEMVKMLQLIFDEKCQFWNWIARNCEHTWRIKEKATRHQSIRISSPVRRLRLQGQKRPVWTQVYPPQLPGGLQGKAGPLLIHEFLH